MKAGLIKIEGKKISLETEGYGHAFLDGSFGINETKTVKIRYLTMYLDKLRYLKVK